MTTFKHPTGVQVQTERIPEQGIINAGRTSEQRTQGRAATFHLTLYGDGPDVTRLADRLVGVLDETRR